MSQHSDGIQGFSRPQVDLVIWAADADHTAQEVRGYLTSLNIIFTPCLGSYEGTTEMSYLTTWSDFNKIAGQLCEGQESVLIIGSKDSCNRHKATLLYQIAGNHVDLGRMYSVPIHEAHKRKAWTIPLIQNNGEMLAFVCDHMDIHGQPIIQD